MHIEIGQPAPHFSLPDQHKHIHALSDYKGQWVLLYFYPKDDTPGCTDQACQIRDHWSAFSRLGLTILGISKDTVEKHKRFAMKYNLPFPLLSDEKKEVIKLYDVLIQKKMFGKPVEGTHRTSFLINPQGIIEKIYQDVDPTQHAEIILADVQSLQI